MSEENSGRNGVVIPPLDDNWPTWSRRMKNKFVQSDLWDAVLGTDEDPARSRKAQKL